MKQTRPINNTGNPNWKYTHSKLCKPGYLAAKFARMQKQIDADRAEQKEVLAKRRIK